MKKINLPQIGQKSAFYFLENPWFALFIYWATIFLLIFTYWVYSFKMESLTAVEVLLLLCANAVLSFVFACIFWVFTIFGIVSTAIIWVFINLLTTGGNKKFYWNRVFSPFTEEDFDEMNPGWRK